MDNQEPSTSTQFTKNCKIDEPMNNEDQLLAESIIDGDPEVQKIWNQLCMAINESISENSINSLNSNDTKSVTSGGNRRRKQMVCNGCGLMRSHCAHGYCGSCYIREKIKAGVWKEENQKLCVNCNEMKRHYARGLCRNCYQRVISRPQQKMKEQSHTEVCVECGEMRLLQCKNMCQNCYQRVIVRPKQKAEKNKQTNFEKGICEDFYRKEVKKTEELKNNQRACAECGEIKKHYCNGMCQVCYKRVKIQTKEYKEGNLKICDDCGQLRRHEAKGFCSTCYQRHFMQPKQASEQNMKVCTFCLQLKRHFCKDVCQQCYYLKFKKKMKSPFIKDEAQSPCSSQSIQSFESQESINS